MQGDYLLNHYLSAENMDVFAPMNESVWVVHTSVSGSTVTALLYGIVFFVAVSLNPIILAVIVVKRKLREPSFIFLFCLLVVDFFEAFLSIPFYIATHISREWIIGISDEERMSTCQMVGFLLTLFLSLSVHILALIALDRFIYFVFALKYTQVLKQWVAWFLVFVVLIICIIISSTPFYGFGELSFYQKAGACLFRWRGSSNNYQYVIVYSVEMLIPISAIFTFTLITYCYIKQHLRRRTKRQSEWTSEENKIKPKVVVLNRIFALLLLTQVFCFGPALATVFIGAIVSFENVPDIVFLMDLVLVLSNAAINPIIQAVVWKQVRRVICKCYYQFKSTKKRTSDGIAFGNQSYDRQLTTTTTIDELSVSVQTSISSQKNTEIQI